VRISVALCTSDDASTLPAFLESLRAQTHRPDELVIRDDRSVDDSVSIARAFEAPFPVRVEVNERRLGPGVNHGIVLGDCTGDAIAIASSSDVWMPQRIERLVVAFASDTGYVFSNATLDGTTLWDAAGFNAERREAARRGELLPLVIAHPFIPASTTMIRTDLRGTVSPVPEHVSFDAWLATLALLTGPYAMVDEPLMRTGVSDIAPPAAVMPDESSVERRRTSVRAARRKLSVRDADLHRQGRRAQAAFFQSVIERLGGTPVAGLADRAAHLRLRGTLPDRRTKRIALVLRELRTGRYARYSSGALSALQDLVY